MKARCIDNLGFNDELTIGKIYEVKECDFYNKMYEMLNDKGGEVNFLKTRFEEVKENGTMKELTLQELLNYSTGTKFTMVMGSEDYEIELVNGDLFFLKEKHLEVLDMFPLREILKAKYYIKEDKWKEVSYYDAYMSKGQIKYIQGTEFNIVGTHDEILKQLYESYTYYGITELIDMGKWYIKENQ